MRILAGLLLLASCVSVLSAQGLSGRRAPSFNLPDSHFKRYDILDYRGKWLLVDFMITNCPHCKALTATLEKAKAKYGTKISVLKVVVTPPETQATVAQYIRENKVTSPIVFDMGQVAASFFNATPKNPSFDTPHLFVIDPSGNIVKDWGHSDKTHDILEGGGLIPELDALLAGKK